MKAFALILLSVIVVVQSTYALPHLRARRDAKENLQLSPEASERREKLMEHLIEDVIVMAGNTVDAHKTVFEQVVKYAEEAELKSDALKEQLQNFTDIINRANAITELNSEKDILDLLDLFNESVDLADKYDELENPTEEEKLIKRLLDENGGNDVSLRFLVEFFHLRADYETSIQSYVDSLSEEDKVKDAKFLEWFKEFKDASDIDKYFDLTMEVFNFFEFKEDSDEKKE